MIGVLSRLWARWACLDQNPLAVAVVCVGGFLLIYASAVLTKPGQWLDDKYFGVAQHVAVGPLQEWLPAVGRGVLPGVMFVVVGGVAIVALVHGRWLRVVMAGAVVVLPVVVSPLLRDRILWRPEFGYSYAENTMPSTHAVVVIALAVAVVLMLPHLPLWTVGVLLSVVILAMVGNVVNYAHRPSDVVASLLLVGATAGTVVWIGDLVRARP